MWAVDTGHELAQLLSMSHRPRWLVTTPEGLFDGFADAIESVSWRTVGTTDVFPLDAFYNDYFYPRLAAEILNGGHPAPCRDIASLLRIPGVQTMRQQRMLHTELEGGHAVLCLPDQPDPGLFDGLDTRVKGLPVPVNLSEFHPGSSSTCRYALDLPGKPSEVEINTRLSPAALHCHTLRSSNKPPPCNAGSTMKATESVLHVQTIAVSKYPPESDYSTLSSATTDAKSISDFLDNKPAGPADSYEHVRVWPTLQDEQVRLNKIQQRLGEIVREVKTDDIVLLYISGHGVVPPGQEMFYFVPEDGKADAEFENGLSTAMLADFVRTVPAHRVIVFINACQSGGALDSLAKIVASKAIPNSANPSSTNEQVGIHVVAATIPFQEANAPGGADPFAEALLDTLKQPSVSGRGTVCADDLRSRVGDEVTRILRQKGYNQLPLGFSEGVNFVVVSK